MGRGVITRDLRAATDYVHVRNQDAGNDRDSLRARTRM